MRFYEKSQITLSEDSSTDPKLVRFGEEFEDTDVTALTKSVSLHQSLPVGVNVIDLGNITVGKLIVVKPKAKVVLTIQGQTISIAANKVFKAWVDFTSLSVTITGTAAEVVLVAAGT